MIRLLDIAPQNRVAHIVDGRFRRLYGPGTHRVWTFSGRHDFVTIDILGELKPLLDADPIPDDLEGTTLVRVGEHERVAAFVHGRLRWILLPGRYRLWDANGPVTLLRYDVRAEPVQVADDDPLPPGSQHSEVASSPSQALVLCRHGTPFHTLEPGTWRIWSGGPWSVKVVSLSLQTLELAPQDLLSRDQVQVRVKPAATFRVVDPLRFSQEPDWQNQVHGAVHRALRDVVTARELEPLLVDRAALSDDLLQGARGFLPDLGLEILTVAVRDVILPGEVKDLFNRVTLARKEAEAMAIRRREETAQTRQLANTARLLESNPVLLRLKELEGLSEIAARIDRLTLVGGTDMIKQVMLSDLARPEGDGEG